VGPLAARRIANLKANRRGHVALKLFLVLFLLTLPAEFLANDKPLFVWHDGAAFVPALVAYPETAFGGDFPSEADYRDPAVQELIAAKGWAVWPPIPYSYDTVITDLGLPAPSPPSARNPLGTDDQSRDVLARVVYGFRLSVLFGLILTLLSSALGIAAGAVQGYFGGWVDLGFQRFMEVWGGLPLIYLLIILASVITPGFWTLLGLMLLFGWMSLVDVVRAEFLRARNLDFVRAARRSGRRRPDRHVPPHPAQRDGLGHHPHAVRA
jgi:microcin C transport system permease protein